MHTKRVQNKNMITVTVAGKDTETRASGFLSDESGVECVEFDMTFEIGWYHGRYELLDMDWDKEIVLTKAQEDFLASMECWQHIWQQIRELPV